jgi:hypothetical protein
LATAVIPRDNYIATKKIGAKCNFDLRSKATFRLSGAKLLFSYTFPYSELAQNLKNENWGSALIPREKTSHLL